MFQNNYFNLLLGLSDTDFAKLIDGAIETGLIYLDNYTNYLENITKSY